MPSTVHGLFKAAGLEPAGKQAWGRPVPDLGPGVYVIALSDGPLRTAPIDLEKVRAWMRVAPHMTMASKPIPDAGALAANLARFWHVDEVVLYVGLAGTSLRTRTRQFCAHVVGHNKPHAGGFWLKLLNDDVMSRIDVHWAACGQPAHAEYDMLRSYSLGRASFPHESAGRLAEARPQIPFANIEFKVPADIPRAHGVSRRQIKAHLLRNHTVEHSTNA